MHSRRPFDLSRCGQPLDELEFVQEDEWQERAVAKCSQMVSGWLHGEEKKKRRKVKERRRSESTGKQRFIEWKFNRVEEKIEGSYGTWTR